jgi:hypothetical protein
MYDEFIPLSQALARGTAAVGDRAWPQLREAIEKGKRGTAKCRADGKWGKLDPQWMGCLAEFGQGPEPVHPEHPDSAISHGLARDYQTSSRTDGDMLYLDREKLHRQKVEGGPVRLTECVVMATMVDALWPVVSAVPTETTPVAAQGNLTNAAMPRRKPGKKGTVQSGLEAAMRAEIASGELTIEALSDIPKKCLEGRFGKGSETMCYQARRAVLANLIQTNSD